MTSEKRLCHAVFLVERKRGIEPPYSAWEAGYNPLYFCVFINLIHILIHMAKIVINITIFYLIRQYKTKSPPTDTGKQGVLLYPADHHAARVY